ncbi:MAG: response regulator [Candidatus Micrarchaeia archaeon]
MCKVEQCVKSYEKELKKDGFHINIIPDEARKGGGPFAIAIHKFDEDTMHTHHYTQILEEGKVGLTLDAVGKRIFREIVDKCLAEGISEADQPGADIKVMLQEPAAQEPVNAACAQVQTQRMKRVVVVDDENSVLRLVDRCLNKDYSISTFSNPEAALAEIVEMGCDLLITDKDMPCMKGTELADRVKELSPDTKVIMMTGLLTMEKQAFLSEHESIDYVVSKPFDVNSIKAIVKKQLE